MYKDKKCTPVLVVLHATAILLYLRESSGLPMAPVATL